MSLEEQNLLALESRFPAIAALMRADPQTGAAAILATPSGNPTALLDGIHVHSRYDPLRDAVQQVEREIDADCTAVVCIGFGLGYGPAAARRRFPDRPMLVVEPEPALFRAALHSRDLRPLLTDPGVSFSVSPGPEGLPELLDAMPLARPGWLRLRPGFQARPAAYRAAEETIQSWALRRDINNNTLRRFGKLWVRNLCRNARSLAECPGVAGLEGMFAGIPALVVAGGPTLDEVAPHLDALRQRMLVISVSTPLRAIAARGCAPDFAVVVDPQYWASRFLDWTSLSGSVVVAEPSTCPRAFRATEAAFFLCGSLFPLGETLENAVGRKGQLGAGGSVATSAWDLGRLLGARPLYTAGLDLGFPGHRTHCRGVYTEELWISSSGRLAPAESSSFRSLRDIGPFPARSTGGGTTLSDRRMLLYKWWFENQLRMRPDAATFTLSPDGIAIEGIPLVHARTLMDLPVRRPEIDDRMARVRGMAAAALNDPRPLHDLRAALGELQAQLADMKTLAVHGVEVCDALRHTVSTHGDARGPLEELDRLDADLLSLSARNIAGFLIQPLIHGISDEGERALEAREVIDRSAAMYQGIADSAGFQGSLIARASADLSRDDSPQASRAGADHL